MLIDVVESLKVYLGQGVVHMFMQNINIAWRLEQNTITFLKQQNTIKG